MISAAQIRFFETNGYLIVEGLLTLDEVSFYREIYEDFLNGTIETGSQRSDLSGLSGGGKQEKITQIMRPSLLHLPLQNSIIHQRASLIAKLLQGDDMTLDFDMLIDKPPNTNTTTPWHQDEAYWIDMDDKRAVSCWTALDDVVKENGCMWFVPKSHLESIRPHEQTGNGGALKCQATEAEAVPAEIKAGSCTFHHGRTIHYSRGNNTAYRRRAFITNFRPDAMVDFERAQGFDHLGDREKRQ
ncbi:MAG: phytanoyl-CoA hydroxylase [Polaribacter sp.]|jgi:phytanoyl-CoA hydroxylase